MAAARGGLTGLLKQGWHEIPEVIGSSFMALIGMGMMGAALFTYYGKDGDNRKHKLEYIVIRDDDPRAARVRSGPDN